MDGPDLDAADRDVDHRLGKLREVASDERQRLESDVCGSPEPCRRIFRNRRRGAAPRFR
jgi:hypothetical protein